MKLDARKGEPPAPRNRVARCPMCGFKGIQWRLVTSRNLVDAYTCPDCGYEGTVLLETDED